MQHSTLMSTTPRTAGKAPKSSKPSKWTSPTAKRAWERIVQALKRAFASETGHDLRPQYATVMDLLREESVMNMAAETTVDDVGPSLKAGRTLAKLLNDCAQGGNHAERRATELGFRSMFFVHVGVDEYKIIPAWALSEAILYRKRELKAETAIPSAETIWQMVRYGIATEHGDAGAALGLGGW